MFYPINKGIDAVNAEYQSIQEKGTACYIFDKIQERNPFKASHNYKKESKALAKKITILKQMKKSFTALWKEQQDPVMQNKLVRIGKRIQELETRLQYLHIEERGQTLLKWAAPCNLILPGSGDALRFPAYSLKFMNAAYYYFQQGSLDEIKRVAQAFTFASVTSQATKYVYQHIKSLKDYLTYPNFKALFTY